MTNEIINIKSKATTINGIIKALEKETDFLADMTSEEKKAFVIGATKEGSLEADGKRITLCYL